MKKFILALATAVSIFSATPAVAFDWENSVFKPLMIFSVYEDVIPSEEPVILNPPLGGEGSREAQQETKQPAQILNQVQNDIPQVIPSSTPRELRLEESEVEESLYNRQLPFTLFEFPFCLNNASQSLFKYKDAILELRKKLWHPPKDPSVITLKYWNNLTEKQQKELHYYRNEYQRDLPKTEKEAKKSDGLIPDWWCIGTSASHNLSGANGNNDCRGIIKNNHIQAVYDKNGDLVTTLENMGTYDFANPFLHYYGHVIIDIKPWIEWGNSPDDTTTKEWRIAAMAQNTITRIMLYCLGYKI